MEIIEIIILFCFFFNLKLENTFILYTFYHLFMYYRNNRHILVANPHIFNVCFVFLILISEILFIYFKLSLYYLIDNQLFRYLYNKLYILNNYYLEKKNNIIAYISNKKDVVLNYLFRPTRITKINTEEDSLLFLNSLKIN